MNPQKLDLKEFFRGSQTAGSLFEVLNRSLQEIGQAELRVTKSQIAFRRKKAFAWAWMPGKYLRGNKKIAPLVLTVALRRKDLSTRWKRIVEPYPGRFTHHLELRSSEEINAEVVSWLREAWEAAG